MRRHSTDPVALLAGALFITVGAAYLGGALSDTKIEARWVLPTVLITLGLAGLLVSLVNLARQRHPAGVTTQPVGGGAGLETVPQEATEQKAAEPETLELRTESPEAEPPQTVPPGTTPADTSPTEADIESGDEPRDRP